MDNQDRKLWIIKAQGYGQSKLKVTDNQAECYGQSRLDVTEKKGDGKPSPANQNLKP
jgi:hypothetical protein